MDKKKIDLSFELLVGLQPIRLSPIHSGIYNLCVLIIRAYTYQALDIEKNVQQFDFLIYYES